MSPLEVISLDDAKAYLVMTGISDRDAEITRLIKTAIALVEKYTDHYLYEREITIDLTCSTTNITKYPFEVVSVKRETTDLTYNIYQKVLSINLVCHDWKDGLITANVGYGDVTDIPQPLVSAAYKIITYLFENKDAYTAELPLDIQMMINQYRRSATI